VGLLVVGSFFNYYFLSHEKMNVASESCIIVRQNYFNRVLPFSLQRNLIRIPDPRPHFNLPGMLDQSTG
jgi:hypothetical protein